VEQAAVQTFVTKTTATAAIDGPNPGFDFFQVYLTATEEFTGVSIWRGAERRVTLS
jgi:hypothetical protein